MSRRKVLLVDDAKAVLMIEQSMLQATDFEVMLAHDGEEAVATAILRRPDIIVMDVVMPKMDGIEACRQLRARRETRTIPIIMVTTRGEAQCRKAGFDAGCNDYVTKPFNTADLLAVLRKHLDPNLETTP
jgi:DNA-binding response OmpR family regulator